MNFVINFLVIFWAIALGGLLFPYGDGAQGDVNARSHLSQCVDQSPRRNLCFFKEGKCKWVVKL